MTEMFYKIVGERVIGSVKNKELNQLICDTAMEDGFETILFPFVCKYWKKGKSSITRFGVTYEIYTGPFSASYAGSRNFIKAGTMEELACACCEDDFLILTDSLSASPLMPMNFPFYFPEEHKQLIELIEEKKPAAVIAVTGKHPMCGLNPFPLFEDGNFKIPNAYIDSSTANIIFESNDPVFLEICSDVTEENCSQLVVAKKKDTPTAGRIVICAHMDTKNDTPGALDNAAGVAVLLEVMKKLSNYNGPYDLEFVPFNGEEHYEVKGQLEYLNYIQHMQTAVKMVINIDSPCMKGSKTAYSTYNFDKSLCDLVDRKLEEHSKIEKGPEWYAGDHVMFAFRGTPCMAVTSSNLFEDALELTHTPKDTAEQVELHLIEVTAAFIVDVIRALDSRDRPS
ncbi:M28 family peptidase [Anoxybacterium hadale]|uniref:M28 family peptidase n=1 Tax=Anoxybacterium hadale TaxID=3408580 RepID=A0ACD1AGJ6_9FIRM|nr:M28 family peptidase [Clostridiales bacterium]